MLVACSEFDMPVLLWSAKSDTYSSEDCPRSWMVVCSIELIITRCWWFLMTGPLWSTERYSLWPGQTVLETWILESGNLDVRGKICGGDQPVPSRALIVPCPRLLSLGLFEEGQKQFNWRRWHRKHIGRWRSHLTFLERQVVHPISMVRVSSILKDICGAYLFLEKTHLLDILPWTDKWDSINMSSSQQSEWIKRTMRISDWDFFASQQSSCECGLFIPLWGYRTWSPA